MKGIVFNSLENFVEKHYDPDTLDEILDGCDLETKEPFVGPKTYPYSDLVKIATKASEHLDIKMPDLMVKFGHHTFGEFANRYSNFLENHTHPKDFLLTIEDVVHVEVRKLYNNTYLPTFQYTDTKENELIITYFSKRKLYHFMEGLINGVADHFGVSTQQDHTIYQKDGHEFCDFHLTFEQ